MTSVIITMAGFGRRFRDAGYSVPKYQIRAHGRSLFAWSMLSLDQFIKADAAFVFIVRSAEGTSEFIAQEAALMGIRRFEIVQIAAPTDGQATTAMEAASVVSAQEPMLIYNIDTFVFPWALPTTAVRGDGWIPCFAAEGDHWSFADADAEGRVSAVREKKRISPHATIGLYWFSSFDLFRRAYHACSVATEAPEAGERYVAPLYNWLISQKRTVFIHDVPLEAVIPLGVPEELRRFEARDSPCLELR